MEQLLTIRNLKENTSDISVSTAPADGLALLHYSDVIMGMMASPITRLAIVYSNIYSGADQRKYQSSASLAFVLGIHQWPVNSRTKDQ